MTECVTALSTSFLGEYEIAKLQAGHSTNVNQCPLTKAFSISIRSLEIFRASIEKKSIGQTNLALSCIMWTTEYKCVVNLGK